jgi:hypothetical protein
MEKASAIAAAEKELRKKNAVLSEEELRELFDRLEHMLKNHNPGCVNLLDDISAVPGTEDLVREMGDYNFKQALALLAKIKEEYW